MINAITATKKFNAIHPRIHMPATELYVYELRTKKSLDTFIDKVSAVVDNKSFYKDIYHSDIGALFILYVKLTANNDNDMFYQIFYMRFELIRFLVHARHISDCSIFLRFFRNCGTTD